MPVHQEPAPAGVQQVTVWLHFQDGGETSDAPGGGREAVPGRGGGESLCQGWVGPAEGNIRGQARHRNEKHKSKKFICRRCGAGFPRKDSHQRHAGQCKGKKKNMERKGRKPAGVTNLELMRAVPGAPEEDIVGLLEMADQGEANNAQLRAVTYRAKQVLKDSLHLGQTKAECGK